MNKFVVSLRNSSYWYRCYRQNCEVFVRFVINTSYQTPRSVTLKNARDYCSFMYYILSVAEVTGQVTLHYYCILLFVYNFRYITSYFRELWKVVVHKKCPRESCKLNTMVMHEIIPSTYRLVENYVKFSKKKKRLQVALFILSLQFRQNNNSKNNNNLRELERRKRCGCLFSLP